MHKPGEPILQFRSPVLRHPVYIQPPSSLFGPQDIIRAFNAGKKLPTDEQIPITAADFSGAVPFLYDGSKAS